MHNSKSKPLGKAGSGCGPRNSNETEGGQPRGKLLMIKWEYLLCPHLKQNITVKGRDSWSVSTNPATLPLPRASLVSFTAEPDCFCCTRLRNYWSREAYTRAEFICPSCMPCTNLCFPSLCHLFSKGQGLLDFSQTLT